MTDDALITLWSLAGMELWAEFKRIRGMRDLEWIVRFQTENRDLLTTVAIRISDDTSGLGRLWWAWFDDILSFNPDERWWKLLFARRWYEKNKEQFHD